MYESIIRKPDSVQLLHEEGTDPRKDVLVETEIPFCIGVRYN